jgi:hypothetical protein
MTMDFLEALGWQVVGQINTLTDGVDGQGWPVNCCPTCCGPCHALLAMIEDPTMLNQLSEIIKLTGWNTGGWDFWSEVDDMLHVGKIKAMWFNEDGSHKSICMSSDGTDTSEELHAMIREDIADRRARLGDV